MTSEHVMVVGDLHGNEQWAQHLIAVAAEADIRRIVQTGDFGYWIHQAHGRRYIETIDRAARLADVTVDFIDGNHEYHHTHPARPPHKRLGLSELARNDDGSVSITDRIIYRPRGHRWHISNVVFAAVGGGVSIDRDNRRKFRDWWPREQLTGTDVERLGQDPVDVLVTHDAPAGFDVPDPDGSYSDRAMDPASTRQRDLLADAVHAVRPAVVFHGHWHVRHTTEVAWVDSETTNRTGSLTWASTRVEGLGADCSEQDHPGSSWTILDLGDLSVSE